MPALWTVVVDGSVGVGKATFLEYVESKNHELIQCVKEPVEKRTNIKANDLLKLFNQYTTKYAFVLQSLIHLCLLL